MSNNTDKDDGEKTPRVLEEDLLDAQLVQKSDSDESASEVHHG